MALYPFYHTYDIDDQNIGCGRIIAVQCDGTHVYIDPCDVLLDCFDGRPEIDRCDMVNPTSDPDQPGIQGASSGRVLRVTNDGSCVEFVDPEVAFPFEDRLVTVSSNDTTAGTLIEKIVSCDTSVLSINEVNDGGNELLELCVNVPDTFLELNDTPPAYTCQTVRYDQNSTPDVRGFVMINDSGVDFECDYRQHWASVYTNADIILEYETQHVLNYPGGGQPVFEFFADHPGFSGVYTPPAVMDIFYGDPGMNAGDGKIRITRSGMYKIEAHGAPVVNRGVDAIRLLIVTTNGKILVADDKFGGDSDSTMVNIAVPDANNAYVGMQPQNLVWLEEGDIIMLGCRTSIFVDYDNIVRARDTVGNVNIPVNTANWISRIRFFNSALAWGVGPGNPDNGAPLTNNPFPGLTMRAFFVSPYRRDAT